MKVLNHLDFSQKSQLINLVIHKGSTVPTEVWEGGLFYLEATGGDPDELYWCNGIEWKPLIGDDTLELGLAAAAGIAFTKLGGKINISTDPDDSTLENASGDANAKIRIKDLGVTAAKLAADSVITSKILDKNVTLPKLPDMTRYRVLGRVHETEAGVAQIEILTTIPEETIANHDSLASAKAIQAYIGNLTTAIGTIQAGYNATTNSAFPDRREGSLAAGDVIKGDYWFITHPGDLGTAPNDSTVDVGDVIIAGKDNPSTTSNADWIVLETNREVATEAQYGWTRLTTEAEAQAFSSAVLGKVLTPANLVSIRATEAQTQDASGVSDDAPYNQRFVTPKGLASRSATETRTGIAEIATDAEVIAGTDDERFVTPKKLKDNVTVEVEKTEIVWADLTGGNSSQIVTHNLGTTDVVCHVYKKTTMAEVVCDKTNNGINQTTISFADAALNPLNEHRACFFKLRPQPV